VTIADKVTVQMGKRTYDIIIGSAVLESAGVYISAATSANHFVIITDNNIPESYISTIKCALNKARIDVVKIAAGESSKSFSCFNSLLDSIFETLPDRNTTLIALGGGVVGDIVGFAASVILRGIDFIQIPTTLLSQVDSSVGGKTGINNKFGKNLIGSFYQPKLVLIDIDTLKTLPKREFLAGYAEVVKYGLINDKAFFNWLDDNLDDILSMQPAALKKIITTSCKSKAEIVAQDEKESGVRALLNLGHTFAHALEHQAGYDGSLVHGEAVSIGMVMAFCLSNRLGFCSDKDIDVVKHHLVRSGLPIYPSEIKKIWDVDLLLEAMKQDKKVSDGMLVFILVKSIGDAFIQKNVAANVVRDTILQNIINS
jgi:3-dehydroquinate synthase